MLAFMYQLNHKDKKPRNVKSDTNLWCHIIRMFCNIENGNHKLIWEDVFESKALNTKIWILVRCFWQFGVDWSCEIGIGFKCITCPYIIQGKVPKTKVCETVLPLKVFLSFDQRVYLTILSKQLWFRRKTVKWYEDMKIRRYHSFSGLLTSLLAGLQNVNQRFKSDFRLKYLPTTPRGKMWRQTSTLLNENKCLFVTSRECQRQCKGLWRSSLGWSTPARTSRGQSHKSGSFFLW